MSHKVTVIGAGSVGSTIAYTLAANGIASEIVLIDINESKCEGEAMDINQGISFCPPSRVIPGSYDDAVDSDIVILTSGIARKPGQSRLDLAQTNVNITKQIIPEITKAAPNAIYIIVSNPVDILTYLFCKTSGIPENRIIGSGTILDTARLRTKLSEHFGINQNNVHAYVFGEHGDSSFVPWSRAMITNVLADEYADCLANKENFPPIDHDEVESYIRKSGGKIIEKKGATFYAVALSACHICKCLFSGMDTALTVSSMMHGEYGIEDVCLSTVCSVDEEGIRARVQIPLNEKEQELLKHSADCLKNIISQLDI